VKLPEFAKRLQRLDGDAFCLGTLLESSNGNLLDKGAYGILSEVLEYFFVDHDVAGTGKIVTSEDIMENINVEV
jgi:hypothetical protein